MEKKIGTFLLIMLALCAVLLMMATGSRGERQRLGAETNPTEPQSGTVQETPTQPTDPTGETTEPTAPPETGSDAPSLETTGPTMPPETEPQPTAPAEEVLPPPMPSEEVSQRVRQILAGEPLAKTARSHWVWQPNLNYREGTTGTALSSNGWALALIAAERKMNPISAFWVLNRNGIYSRVEDDSVLLNAASFAVPGQDPKEYAYTDGGARQLVTDILALASGLEDGLTMESGLLGANSAVDEGQMALSRKEGCYYGYFISSGERSIHILCFYLRSGQNGKTITDVEFQLLNLRSAEGSAEALADLDRRGDTQAAALIAAAELLMTGQTQAGQGLIPFTRQVESFTATIERSLFTGETENGSLTNYRLRKE